MGKVTYPYHVKSGGKYYAPGEPVETEAPAEATVDKPEQNAQAEAPRRGRPPKK